MDNETVQYRLPLIQAIIYASGYFGVMLIGFSVGQIPMLYYLPVEGAPLIAPITILGAILLGNITFGMLNAFGRVIDGVVDPWIGNISDHFRSRFGRRKPFLVIGAPLMGVFLFLFTIPPSAEPSMANFFYLAVIYPLFFLFFTIAITPYLAMLPEITKTSPDRLLVTTLQAGFLILGTFTGVIVIQFIPGTLSFQQGALLIGAIATIPFLLVAAFVKIPDETSQEEIPVRPSTFSQIKSALAFAPFRIYLISTVAFWFGFKMVETSAKYVSVHLFKDEGVYIIILGTALGVAAVAGIGSYWLGRTIGKRRSMIVMSILFAILLPLVGLIGKGPLANPIFGYILFGLLGLPLSLLFVIPNSLLADIIDLDREQTGERREGLYFASQALLNKIGIGLSKALLATLLPIGAIATEEGTHAVGEMGVRMIGPVAAFFVIIGLLIFLKFPDIEKR
ncbi:MFS transporter [bacterium]|nr:MFS transporter [bacterium]